MASLITAVQELAVGHSGSGEIDVKVDFRNKLATCKIETLTGWGSGSLIKLKNVGFCILTNNHVLPSEMIADGAEAHFVDHDDNPTSVTITPNTFFVIPNQYYRLHHPKNQPATKTMAALVGGSQQPGTSTQLVVTLVGYWKNIFLHNL